MSHITNAGEQLLIDQVIANIEKIVIETSKLASDHMEVDNDKRNSNKNNVTIILNKILNACEEMIKAGKCVFSTSEQIITISRILPFLTNAKETEQKIAEVCLPRNLNIHYLNSNSQASREDRFRVEFYKERFVNWMESANNSIKDTFTEYGFAQILLIYLSQTLSEAWIGNEDQLLKKWKTIITGTQEFSIYLKTNAKSQEVILMQNQNEKIIDRVLKLSQARTNEKKLRILADSIIGSLTNESDMNDPNTLKYVNTL